MYSEEYIEAIKGDFRNFCHHIWKVLSLPPLTPVQNDIAEYLQHGPKKATDTGFPWCW